RSLPPRIKRPGPARSEVSPAPPSFAPPPPAQARREDWPSLSSLVMRYGSPRGGLPAAAVLPWYLQFPGQPRRIAGQTGGRMGERHSAFLLRGDLGRAAVAFDGLRRLAQGPAGRLRLRRELVRQVATRPLPTPATAAFDDNCRIAHELLASRAAEALDLRREPRAVRQRYGLSAVGQSLLLARRLVEAGVGLVTVHWQDETITDRGDTRLGNPHNNLCKLRK